MKRKILFAILCIGVLSISTIVYASFIQTTDTSTLSDREMELITGKCSCYEWDWQICRWWGDAECVGGDTCTETWTKYFDNWVPQVSLDVYPPNGKTPYFSGKVDCSQPYYVESNGTLDDAICYTGVPTGYNIHHWASWFYSCKSGYPGQECTKCKWGSPNGSIWEVDGYNCQ